MKNAGASQSTASSASAQSFPSKSNGSKGAETRAPPVSSPGALAIDDAIGSLLTEVQTSPLPSLVAEAVAGLDEDVAASELRLWPLTTFTVEASFTVLKEATSLGLAADYPDAPPGQVTLAFVRTLSLTEQRLFDPDPPAELPDPPLAAKCMNLRLRLFALTRDAGTTTVARGVQLLIDDEALVGLSAEVNAVNGELQKAIDGFLATGQAQRIKEVNTFRNALTRGHTELRSAVARLRGEVTARSNIALLDVETRLKTDAPAAARAEPAPVAEKKNEPKPAQGRPDREMTGKERERRRLVVYLVLLVVLSAVGFWTKPVNPRALNRSEFSDLADAQEVIVNERLHRAAITTSDVWQSDAQHLHSLDAFLQRFAIDSYIVRNQRGEALVVGSPGKPQLLTRSGRPPK